MIYGLAEMGLEDQYRPVIRWTTLPSSAAMFSMVLMEEYPLFAKRMKIGMRRPITDYEEKTRIVNRYRRALSCGAGHASPYGTGAASP